MRNAKRLAMVLAVLVVGGLVWASLWPLSSGSREQLYQIPRGTSERRLAGEDLDILPHTIRLTLGQKDVLALKNNDAAPHIFGPTLIMPGQTFRLPFTTASTNSFVCTAHADGQLTVVVEAEPTPGWQRLRWRWRSMTGTV
jgi:hypothetical protein